MPLVDKSFGHDMHLLKQFSQGEERKPAPHHADLTSSSKSQKELQATICLLLVELCEKFTFFGIVCNLILFCTMKLSYPNYQAATISLCFVGTCMLTPVLMGWLAECTVGRIKLVYVCALLHFVGTALLPVVAFPFEDFFIDKHCVLHTLAKRDQQILFYVGLLATSLGSGGIRAIVCPLSIYNLDDHGGKELLSFFNWYLEKAKEEGEKLIMMTCSEWFPKRYQLFRFYWVVNLSSAVVLISISYIQQSVAKNLGFLIPFVSVLMALITIHMARSEMIYQPPKGSCLLTVCGVIMNAFKVCCLKCQSFGEGVPNWLDHAKENYGGQYSESQVESTKSLVRLLPLFAFQILYRMCAVQIPSAYYLQTMNSSLDLNGFLLPIAAMNVISIVPYLILAPLLDCFNTCFFSAKMSGWPHIVCIVIGYTSATLSVMAAGIFEVRRKHFPLVEQTLSGKVLLVSSMPCVHLAPQYILLGVAEAMVIPTCSLITFKFVPSRIRGMALQTLTFFNGAGCILEAFLLQAAYVGSQGDWFPNILHEGKLERFYFFLASLMVINTLGFWTVSHRYCNQQEDYDEGGFRGSLQEQLLQHEKSLKFYDSILDCPSILSPMETVL